LVKTIKPEIIQRLVFAKILFKKGESACLVPNDILSFSVGLILFHDACDAALGAVASEVGASVKENTYLLNYFDLIEKTDPQKRKIPYRAQLINLNTFRSNIKHKGIFYDPKTQSHFPATIKEFLKSICNDYFKVDFDTLSLKESIKDEKLRGCVDVIEKEIEKRRYRESLEQMGKAMFEIFEGRFLSFKHLVNAFKEVSSGKKIEEFNNTAEFPVFDHVKDTIELLEKGINPYLYHRFKNLTPKVGKESGLLSLKWEKLYGHRANWTEENVRFCYDFLLDAILKFQGEQYKGYTLVQYSEVFVDSIESLVDGAKFFKEIPCLKKGTITVDNSGGLEEIFKLKRGEKIFGTTIGYSDYWLVISKDIPSLGIGYVKKTEVKMVEYIPKIKK